MFTIEAIERHLDTDRPTATIVLGLIRGDVDPFSVPAVAEWKRACYHEPSAGPEAILRAIDATLGTYGTEPIDCTKHYQRYWHSCAAVYVNVGDTYEPTILFDTIAGKYRLTTLGDFVESYDRRYGLGGDA